MKYILINSLLVSAILLVFNLTISAQTKKGKSTKSKELIECEQLNDSLKLSIQNAFVVKDTLLKTIDSLTTENKSLKKKASRLYITNISVINYDPGKGNKSEISTKSKSINKTSVSFDFIEKESNTNRANTIAIAIIDSKGNNISSQDKKSASKESNNEKSFSYEGKLDTKKMKDKVKIDIKHAKKLIPDWSCYIC